ANANSLLSFPLAGKFLPGMRNASERHDHRPCRPLSLFSAQELASGFSGRPLRRVASDSRNAAESRSSIWLGFVLVNDDLGAVGLGKTIRSRDRARNVPPTFHHGTPLHSYACNALARK